MSWPMSSKPESWTVVPLGDLSEIVYGKALPASDRTSGGAVPVFASGGVVGYHDEALVEHPSVVIGRKGSVGTIHLTSGPFWCIDTAFYLDGLGEQIDLEYLAIYLKAANLARLAITVGVPGLNRQDLARVPVLVPPLSEQQRIVEVLREANGLFTQSVARRKKLGSIVERSLKSVIEHCEEQEWHPLGRMIDTKYGTSVRADAEAAAGVPVLRIPNVLGGEISLADLKYAVLPDAERERLALVSGDVLIVRSNGNPDYVGRCAPVDEVIADTGCVYASYLIRLRPNSKRLRGFYLAALLNSQIGRNAMRNAIRTTAGQSNLSAESLASVRLPVPSMDDQLRFEIVWKGVQLLRRQLETSEKACQKLVEAILAEALSGRLTVAWREQHRAELEAAIHERDAALGTHKPRMEIRITEQAEPERDAGFDRPRRQALIDQLSSFQHEVWNALRYEWRGAVLADDPRVVEDFCTGTAAWRLEGFQAGREEVRRALEQLAALGLIRKMSLPRDNPATRRTEYLTAFRPLRKDPQGSRAEEDSALADTKRVSGELKRRVRERR